MTRINKLLAVADSQIGVTEDPPRSNCTRYGEDYGWNGVPWCAMFVWWCFKMAGAAELIPKTASCNVLEAWAKNQGRWVTEDFRPGDVLLYDFEGDGSVDHTGICESVRETSLTAIEGNTSDGGSQDNGGAVLRKIRPLYTVLGALRPAWSGAEEETKDETGKEMFDTAVLKTLSDGCMGPQVRAMQQLLIAGGFSCGRCADDGEFGPMTQAAVRRFQKDRALEVDGICGPKTWAKLLGA